MALEHVQPGDLITSQLINDIIDALGKLDAKITKCCQEKDTTPTSPPQTPPPVTSPPQTTPPDTTPPDGQKPKLVIDRVVPGDASPNDTVTIIGRGFGSKASGIQVTIGAKAVTKFGKVTDESIEVVVPTLGFRERARVDVVVTLDDRSEAKGTMTVGPRQGELKTGIALLKVAPTGKLVAGTNYTLEFIAGSTGKDNLAVEVALINAKGQKTGRLVKKEFSFAAQTTQKFEVPLAMPKKAAVMEVDLLNEKTVVASESFTFTEGQDPPVNTDGEVFGPPNIKR
jgi:IPT/TIG domain